MIPYEWNKFVSYVRWVIFKIFISNIFWLVNSNLNLMQSKNINMFYYIVYTINIFIIP